MIFQITRSRFQLFFDNCAALHDWILDKGARVDTMTRNSQQETEANKVTKIRGGHIRGDNEGMGKWQAAPMENCDGFPLGQLLLVSHI